MRAWLEALPRGNLIEVGHVPHANLVMELLHVFLPPTPCAHRVLYARWCSPHIVRIALTIKVGSCAKPDRMPRCLAVQ